MPHQKSVVELHSLKSIVFFFTTQKAVMTLWYIIFLTAAQAVCAASWICLCHSSCTIMVICPLWPSQPWFPSLSSYLIECPVLLPPSSTLLSNPGYPDAAHPLLPQMRLISCKVSGNNYLRTNFHHKLSKSCSPAGKETHRRTTCQSVASGYHFAWNGITIPVLHL